MTQPRDTRTLALQDLLWILRRRAPVFLAFMVLVPGATLAFSLFQEKEYSASASLLFRDPALDQKLFGSTFVEPQNDPAREAATNVNLVSLKIVADGAAEKLGGAITGEDLEKSVDIGAEGQSDLVSVTATDPSPRQASRIANTFAGEYIAFRREADRSKISEAQGLVDSQLRSVPFAQRGGARARSLQERLEELGVLASLQTGNAELIQPADPPTAASSPRPLRNTAVGMLLGLILGVVSALILERLDRRFKHLGEISDALERPILGVVPRSVAFGREPADGRPQTPEAEAFRMLRANLRYFNVDQNIDSVLITSATSGDGKTTIAWNLARAAAASGSRTLLIEADLRQPSIARVYGLDPTPGLTELLAADRHLAEVVQRVRVTHGPDTNGSERHLDVVVSGALPPNPTELLESDRMRSLLTTAERDYELVIIDTPPTPAVSDAIPLMEQVSGVVVVSRLDKSTRDATLHLRDQLSNLSAPLLGVVVNSVDLDSQPYGYGSAYGYGYGDPDAVAASAPPDRSADVTSPSR